MAKLQSNPIKNRFIDIPHTNKDTLFEIFNRAYAALNIPKEVNLSSYFHIYVNGHKIGRDFWEYTKVKDDCNIVIVMIPQGGNFGSILRVAALVAIAVAAPYVAASYGALIGVGFALTATLAVNALIPGPKNNLNQNSGYQSFQDSQMYTIANQGNQTRKYQKVPKVYGIHRVFPSIVNTPYTTIEADPDTGQKVQFLYAVYDFGLGPMTVEEIKIGETSIDNFTNINYRLVDPNKPIVSTGFWDDVLSSEFTIYKGDAEPQQFALSYTRQEEPKNATRSASPNDNNVRQEILISFIAPQGLTTVGTNAGRLERYVEFKVEFSEVGANDWKSYDDFSEVETVNERTLYGTSILYNSYNLADLPLLSDVAFSGNDLAIRSETLPLQDPGGASMLIYSSYGSYYTLGGYIYKRKGYGILKNTSYRLWLSESLPVGTEVSLNSSLIGAVSSKGTGVTLGTSTFFPSNRRLTRADDFNFATSFTIECLIYPTVIGTQEYYVLGKGGVSTDTQYGIVINSDSTISFFITNSIGTQYTATHLDVLTVNQWYFISAKYDSSANEVSINVNNGTRVVEVAGVVSDANIEPFYIGGRSDTDTFGFIGRIDELVIHNDVIADSLSSLYYNDGDGVTYETVPSNYTGSLISWFKMGDGNSTHVDSNGGLNLSASGAGTLVSSAGKTFDANDLPVGGYYAHNFEPRTTSIELFYKIERYTDPGLSLEATSFLTKTHASLTRVIPAGIFTMGANTSNPYYSTVTFTPYTRADIEVRVTRVRSYGGYSFQISDDITWAGLTTRFQINTVNTTKRHVFLELKIKATDQLNGAVDTLNALCTSVVDVYDSNTQTWAKQPSSNPAWIFTDLLTGEVNKRAIDKSRLDLDKIVEWAEFCDEVPTAPVSFVGGFSESRFRSNFVLDYDSTLKQILDQVAHAAQASLNIVNGKYGVLIDKLKTIPVQVFTTRNSWNFRSNRRYVTPPHALNISYVDPASGWELRDAVVYDDGYDRHTAETFEDMKSFGITNPEQAWRYGRYMLAQGRLRQETISIDVDFENLVCTRGDYVLLAHDVMRVGGTPTRVKAVSGTTITIDDAFTTAPMVSYGYTLRKVTGEIITSTLTILTSSTANVGGDVPQVGDLLVWGEVSRITFDCIVKEIRPNSDLSATLTLVEKADAVYDAESSDSLPEYNPNISNLLNGVNTAPAAITDLVAVENSYDCLNNQYEYFISLEWKAPVTSIYELFEIYVNIDNRTYELYDTSKTESYRYVVELNDLGLTHSFRVLAVNSSGRKINLGESLEVTETPLSKTSRPSNIEALNLNITNEVLQLEWPQIDDCDLKSYQIRYSPNLSATWAQGITLLNIDRNTIMTSVQARTGAYMIKAIDWALNESALEARAQTNIPNLFNLNVIEETNDFPTFPGILDRVVDFGDSLILQEEIPGPVGTLKFYDSGEYYYSNLLELGDIFTVRLQSLIEAEGYTPDDIMANWTTLSSVASLSTIGSGSQWNVETYVRGTEELNVMSEWVTLASIDPISEGVQDNFTSWKKFTIGDFTARIFQFKLKLISNYPSVSPRVFDAKIKADMPDRTVSYENQVIPVGGRVYTYSPYFKGPSPSPAISVGIDDSQQGDYYVITDKTTLGFKVEIFDKDDVSVSRTADFAIKGYGSSYFEVVGD